MLLRTLIGRVERIIGNPRYEELRRFWNDFYELKEPKRLPIKITLTMAFFSKNLGINLIDHYEKPAKYVEDSLKILSFQHREILDDRVKEGIVINFGEGFESSLFGSKPIFKSHTDPWVGERARISEKHTFVSQKYGTFQKRSGKERESLGFPPLCLVVELLARLVMYALVY